MSSAAKISHVVLAAVLLNTPIYGQSFSDMAGLTSGYVDFATAGPLEMIPYPCAAARAHWTFQTGYRQLYGLKELTSQCAGLAWSGRQLSCGAAASTFGRSDYYQELSLSPFACLKVGRVLLGSSVVYNRCSFGREYHSISAAAINVALGSRVEALTLVAVSRAVNQPAYYRGGTRIPIEGEFGLDWQSRAGLGSQVRVLFVRRQKPTAILAQIFRLSETAGLSWGVILRPARVGAGLHLKPGRLRFDYHFWHHPDLGPTHALELAISR